jgi:hypothetical protein
MSGRVSIGAVVGLAPVVTHNDLWGCLGRVCPCNVLVGSKLIHVLLW